MRHIGWLVFGMACTGDGGTDLTQQAMGGVYDAFGTNVTVYVDGDDVVFETNGWPDHTTPYWGPGHELYVAPTVTSTAQMAPGYIDRFQGSYTLRVPAEPTVASSSTATGLGPIGIAVSGAVIYNDQEGGNVPIDGALGSLDYTGAHTGPQSYHYHLEPIAWSEDDDALIGVLADGFFLYGRREPASAGGGYPSDLDASSGHIGVTPHSDEAVYHYHIANELYLGQYYILFPGDYQGSPSAVQ
ncbi:MAG: YHYH protein [Myxococcales bacterium]|nr:YHYH protein [Myxococcales bacterium]